MSKFKLILLLTTVSLFVPACNKNSTNVMGAKAPGDTMSENNRGSEDNDTPEPKPPYASTTLVQITCDSGCKVKKAGDAAEQSVYKNYFDNNVSLNFTFSKTNLAYDYPALLVKAIKEEESTSTVVTELTGYEYNRSTGTLTFDTDFSDYNIVTIDAYAVEPTAEIKFHSDDPIERQDLSFQYSGSLTALDFNGDVVSSKDIGQIEEGKAMISHTIYFDGNQNATLKLYGNCSNIQFSGGTANLTELRLNHMSTFDLIGFVNNAYRSLKKIYIGPDVTNVANIDLFKESVVKGGCIYLNEIEVSKENRFFDSRDNCNCLIETNSNRLLLGSGEGFVPNGVTDITSGAFGANQRVSYIRLPSSVTTIEQYAFARSSLSYIEFSENLSTVMDNAFLECNNLIMVDFSNMSKAPNMRTAAFSDCRYILEHRGDIKPFIHHDLVILNTTIFEQLSMVDDGWREYQGYFVSKRNDLPSFVMVSELDPDFIPSEKEEAEFTKVDFSSNDKIDIDQSLVKVFDPFQNEIYQKSWSEAGSSVKAGGLYSDPAKWDGNRASYIVASYPVDAGGNPVPFSFSFRDKATDNLYLRNAEDISFIKHFGDYDFKEVETESGTNFVPAIDDRTFKGLTSLTDFVYSASPSNGSVAYIGSHAFEDTGIRSAEIPAVNLQWISDFAFAGCTNLKTFHLDDAGRVPSTVQPLNIGNLAFAGDIGLTSFNLPSYVNSFFDEYTESISNPFAGCSSINTINCSGDTFSFGTDKVLSMTSKKGDMFAISVFDNKINPSIMEKYQRFANGAFTSLKASTPIINLKLLPIKDPSNRDYALAYMSAKEIILTSDGSTTNYMFAHCKNLEVLNLTRCNLEDGYIDKKTLFEGTNPNFRVKIPSEKELSNYKDILGLDDESKFFWDEPEPESYI